MLQQNLPKQIDIGQGHGSMLPPRTRQEVSLYSHLLAPVPQVDAPDWLHEHLMTAGRLTRYSPTAADLAWVPVAYAHPSAVMEAVEASDRFRFRQLAEWPDAPAFELGTEFVVECGGLGQRFPPGCANLALTCEGALSYGPTGCASDCVFGDIRRPHVYLPSMPLPGRA